MTARTGLALSIRQPWAWAIIRPDIEDPGARERLRAYDQLKPVENRTWPTDVRGWIGIHAAQTFDPEGLEWIRDTFPAMALPEEKEFRRGGIIGRATLVDCVENYRSPWFCGPFGFVLEDAEPLPFRACRGQLRFFRPQLAR